MDAKTLTIFFAGLIAHVQLPGTFLSTAVLPDDGRHEAAITIRRRDLMDPSVDMKWFGTLDANGNYTKILGKTHIEIAGIERTETNASAITDLVPSLTKISTCKELKSEVKSRTPGGPLGVFVDYSGGVLKAAKFFASMAYFDGIAGWEVPQCFACTIRLTTRLNDKGATMIFITAGERRSVVLRRDAVVEISNHLKKEFEHQTGHFENFFSIFADAAQCTHPKVITAEPCQKKMDRPTPTAPTATIREPTGVSSRSTTTNGTGVVEGERTPCFWRQVRSPSSSLG